MTLPSRVTTARAEAMPNGAAACLTAQAVFEAAAALARFHVQSVAAGGPGLGANNAPGEEVLLEAGRPSIALPMYHRERGRSLD